MGNIAISMAVFESISRALTGVAQLVGHHPTKQKVAGFIPSQGTCLDCGFGPQLGHVGEAVS